MEDSGLKGEQVAEHIGERSETSTRSVGGQGHPPDGQRPYFVLAAP